MWRFLDGIGNIPTTNARIMVTLACVAATCVKVVVSENWHADPEWSLFLAGMSGIDGLQFLAKRVTATEYRAGHTATHPAQPKGDTP